MWMLGIKLRYSASRMSRLPHLSQTCVYPGYPGTHFGDQAVLELGDSPASVLELKVCAIHTEVCVLNC